MSAFWYACVTSVDLTEGYVRGCVSVCLQLVGMIKWCFRAECFPDALIYEGLQHCSVAPFPLHMSSVPPPALTASQPLSDWTGSKGSLSLSVSFLHIDLNDYYALTTAAPIGEFTSAFTSTQTVSLQKIHTSKTSTGFPGTDTQQCNYCYFDIIWPFYIFFLRLPGHSYVSGAHYSQEVLRILIAIAKMGLSI